MFEVLMSLFRKNVNPSTLRHLLTISDDRGVQTFVLDASMYSIGRDPTNAIVVHSDSVSRQHAILLRIPNPDKTYRYAIQDGNLEGKPSANGIIVNGVACKKHILEDGDEIVIGGKVTLLYRTPTLSDAELEEKVTHLEYRRLKGNLLSGNQTIHETDISTMVDRAVSPLKQERIEQENPTKVNPTPIKKEIDQFRECYDAVVHELRDLNLSRGEYITIAVAIYQKLN